MRVGIIIVFVFLFCLLIFFCILLFFNIYTISDLSISDAQIVMQIGHSQPTEHPRHKSLLKFKEIVEERTNGGIEIEIYPSSQLGSEADQIEKVKLGVIQATRGGSFEAAAPKFLIYTMPFLFKNIKDVHKVTRGPIGDKIALEAEKNGIIILATGDAGGLRNFTNNINPITKPDDLKGLKFRTPPIESIIKTIEALGGNPASIPYGEVYMGLKTGVINGQENPFVNITSMKLYEVQDYLSIVNYQYHPDPFFVCLHWYNSLKPKFQDILKEASIEMMQYNDQLIEEATNKSYQLLKQKMKVNVLTEAQRKLFIDKSQQVYDYYYSKGLFTKQEINEIRRLTQ
jgi:C4-dicarboxylate-binding protein DctP